MSTRMSVFTNVLLTESRRPESSVRFWESTRWHKWSQFSLANPVGKLDLAAEARLRYAAQIGNVILTASSGTIGTFDKWAEQVGDDSYKFSNFLPYFQRSARFHPPDTGRRPSNATARYNASDWDSSGGPLQVGYSSWVNPVSSWLGLAFKELGLRELPSLLSGTLLGWSWLSVTLDPATQTRSSSESFLRVAIEENSNLVVYKSTIAKKIVFEDCSAKSVIVDSGGAIYNISANKEIVLSAGVVSYSQKIPYLSDAKTCFDLDAFSTDAYGVWYWTTRAAD